MRSIIFLCAALGLISCRSGSDHASMTTYSPDSQLAADLNQVTGLRIFFGHQSVGANIVEGLTELRSLAGDTALHILHDPAPASLPPTFLAEARIGTNDFPLTKLAAFRKEVDSTYAGRLDVALVKICFVDLERRTGNDPDSVFAAYRKTVLDLEAAHPRLTVIPVTCPLTVLNYGARGRLDKLKDALRRLLGRDDNARRAVFNTQVRQAFSNRVIFDLAAVESTAPDGSRACHGWGCKVESLVPAYSSDGGHLNALGRKVLARAFLRTLAQAATHRRGAP